MKHNPGKILSVLLAILILGQLFFVNLNTAIAAPVYDQNTGTYTDDFSDATGIPTKSHVSANPTPDYLQLLNNPNNTYVAPFWTSGYVVTSAIVPTSVVKWGSISFNSSIVAGQTVTVQVCDRDGNIYTDGVLPGNAAGFTTSPVDISALSPLIVSKNTGSAKIGAIKIKITLTTNNTGSTPTFDDLVVTWTPKQGDLTATTYSNNDWATSFADQQGTQHKEINNPSTYSAYRWASSKETNNTQMTPGFVYNGQFITSNTWGNADDFEVDRVKSLNRDTGAVEWSLPANLRGYFTIGADGTGYHVDDGEDFMMAVNMNTGQVKWTYNFLGGHGNDKVVIGNDGTIYTIRQQDLICDQNACVSKTFTLYAFNPDGTVLSTTDYTEEYYVYPGGLSLAPNGNLIFSSSSQDILGDNTNEGKLYSINPVTKSVEWSYQTGDTTWLVPPTIDASGTIYIGNSAYWSSSFDKKIMAINSDGTLKWEKNYAVAGDIGYQNISLRSDGVIIAQRMKEWDADWYYYTSEIQAINVADGSLLWTKAVDYAGISLTDKLNNLYASSIEAGSGPNDKNLRGGYYDTEGEYIWRMNYPFQDLNGEKIVNYNFGLPMTNNFSLIQDDRGWLFGSMAKYEVDPDYNYSDSFIQNFALAPWTLSFAGLSGDIDPGSTVTLTATSAMQQTNPLFGGANQVQAVMENGDKVALSYSSTDANGDTVWTGTYTIPSDITVGEHTFTIEASQSYMQTDVTTHFATATTESGNTGIVQTGTFRVLGASTSSLESATILPETGSEFSIVIQDYLKSIFGLI